jgi:hypothetical protein
MAVETPVPHGISAGPGFLATEEIKREAGSPKPCSLEFILARLTPGGLKFFPVLVEKIPAGGPEFLIFQGKTLVLK